MPTNRVADATAHPAAKRNVTDARCLAADFGHLVPFDIWPDPLSDRIIAAEPTSRRTFGHPGGVSIDDMGQSQLDAAGATGGISDSSVSPSPLRLLLLHRATAHS